LVVAIKKQAVRVFRSIQFMLETLKTA